MVLYWAEVLDTLLLKLRSGAPFEVGLFSFSNVNPGNP